VHSDSQPHLLINVPVQINGTGQSACGTATRLQARVQGSNSGGARIAPVDKCTFVVLAVKCSGKKLDSVRLESW